MAGGFSKKYNVNKLVYYEVFEDSYNAIAREKQIKAGSGGRKWNSSTRPINFGKICPGSRNDNTIKVKDPPVKDARVRNDDRKG